MTRTSGWWEARSLESGTGSQSKWNSRGHFFAAAAEAMRRILVEQARRKRGGQAWR